MKDFHTTPVSNTAPSSDPGGIPPEALQLAKVLYPFDGCPELRALELMLMENVGATLPKMPSRLPTLTQLEAMTSTERAFCLMVHIAALAIQIEILKSGLHRPTDRNRPVQTQILNARRRLRRACRHAELSHLWRCGRWKVGALMLLVERNKQTNLAMRDT